jgi:xeroderma pigmentosum group C-complementing protein
LLGRYRIAPLGINGILQGSPSSLSTFRSWFTSYLHTNSVYTEPVDWKLGELRKNVQLRSQSFSDLKVQPVREIVSYTEYKEEKKKRSRNKKKIPPAELAAAAAAPPPPPPSPPQPRTSPAAAPISRLTPVEWHAALSKPPPDTVLLDTRNLYESEIGLFTTPEVPTLRPTLRKFSDLNKKYMTSIEGELKGKNVFMYCTGGVRCDTIKEHMATWISSDGETGVKSVSLLEGGICRYLEEYGRNEDEPATSAGESLFLGKNFVFDPRRYDPQISSSVPQIGVCVACGCLHDDYDCGGGHNDNLETRCSKCRVLILLCGECSKLPGTRFFCGNDACLGEAATAEGPELIVDTDETVRARGERGKMLTT